MNSLQQSITKSLKDNYNRVAIVDSSGNEITYQDLSDNVKSYYQYIASNVGENKKILLKFKDISKMIVAMIACIYSNNTFITISGDCSEEREQQIRNIVGDAFELNEDCSFPEKKGIQIELENINIDRSVPTYIFFTSGTTGVPKAVLGKNESLLHFINWQIEEFSIGPNSSFAQVTSPMYDCFLRDIFTPLISGGKIVLKPNDNIIFIPRLLNKWIKDNNINCMHCTPSLLNMIVTGIGESGQLDMDYLFIAGEKILNAYIDKWIKCCSEKTTFVNLYGPTETTLVKCFHVINRKNYWKQKEVSVGKAICNEKVYVLDENHKICQEGDSGEIYISMEYGSWGYLNYEGDNRFITLEEYSSIPFYKTGDIGYRKNGLLYLAGRNDRQVKISGIRVELDAIENAVMEEYPVDNVAVFTHNGVIHTCLVGEQSNVDVEVLRQYIRNMFMLKHISIAIHFIAALNITKNGKKDYRYVKETVLSN